MWGEVLLGFLPGGETGGIAAYVQTGRTRASGRGIETDKVDPVCGDDTLDPRRHTACIQLLAAAEAHRTQAYAQLFCWTRAGRPLSFSKRRGRVCWLVVLCRVTD